MHIDHIEVNTPVAGRIDCPMSPRLCRGSLVIIESSVYPGVASGLAGSILEDKSGLAAGDDFGPAYCFEALTPGTPDIELITRRELSAVSMRRAGRRLKLFTAS